MAEDRYPSDRADKFVLRLPEGMRDRIARVAAQGGRSMNAEVVARLQRTFEQDARREAAAKDDAEASQALAGIGPAELAAIREVNTPGTAGFELAQRIDRVVEAATVRATSRVLAEFLAEREAAKKP